MYINTHAHTHAHTYTCTHARTPHTHTPHTHTHTPHTHHYPCTLKRKPKAALIRPAFHRAACVAVMHYNQQPLTSLVHRIMGRTCASCRTTGTLLSVRLTVQLLYRPLHFCRCLQRRRPAVEIKWPTRCGTCTDCVPLLSTVWFLWKLKELLLKRVQSFTRGSIDC